MPGDERGPSGQRRILIVEDNELNLKLLKDVLDYYGYTTVVTGLGEAAVDIAVDQHPDLILLDIQLPDISGTEVARRLKTDHRTRTIPIIAVTASAMPGDRAHFIHSGCDDYVSKPFRIPEFLELVASYVDGPTTETAR
jgi:two-component system cell cycle response regulator DivK